MTAWHVERCGSSWGQHPESARPTRCSRKPTASASAARTSSSRSPWTTAAPTPGRCSTGSKSSRPGASRTGAPSSRKWTWTPSWPVPRHRDRGRIRALKHPGQPAPQTLAGRRRTPRRRHQCPVHRQHPAPGVPRRRRQRHHRGPAGRDACPTTSSGGPTRSTWWTSPRNCSASAWATARSTPRTRSTPPCPTTSASATSPPCANWPCCGSRTGWMKAWPGTGPRTGSRPAGRPANASSSG